MSPSSKRGFHMLLVLFKVLPSLLLRILGLGRNPNKTLGLELINFSRIPYKIHMIHTRIHTQVSSIPFCLTPLSSLLFFFSFSSSSSTSLFLSSLYGFCLLWRPNLVFSYPCLLRPCLAKSFLIFFSFLHLRPSILLYSQFNL